MKKRWYIVIIAIVLLLVVYDFISTSKFVGAQNKSAVWMGLAKRSDPGISVMNLIPTIREADTSIWYGPATPSFMTCRLYTLVEFYGSSTARYRVIAEVAIDTLNPLRYDSTSSITGSGPNLQSLTMNNATYIRFIAKLDGGMAPDSADVSAGITFDNSPKNTVGS